MLRVAVIGAGELARTRARALIATGEVVLCGVASRHLDTAGAFGREFDCGKGYDDYTRLTETSPDAILVEIPDGVQDEAVVWALDQGIHVLTGGVIAASSATAAKIAETALRKSLVVEAGYSSRYSSIWRSTKDLIEAGELGSLVAINSVALWECDPSSWYGNQKLSGGMPLVHMTYCFINPIRWICGDPLSVSAFGNRIKHTDNGMNEIETCVANFQFRGDVVCNMTAGFVKPAGSPGMSVFFLGEEGSCLIDPSAGTATISGRSDNSGTIHTERHNPFETQAIAFVRSIQGDNICMNTPEATIGDIVTVEAICKSVSSGETQLLY